MSYKTPATDKSYTTGQKFGGLQDIFKRNSYFNTVRMHWIDQNWQWV